MAYSDCALQGCPINAEEAWTEDVVISLGPIGSVKVTCCNTHAAMLNEQHGTWRADAHRW